MVIRKRTNRGMDLCATTYRSYSIRFSHPAFGERKDEIVPIIEALASRKAGKPVRISNSAWRILEKAIWPEKESDALIKSVRQLQMVADVFTGEDEITDSNLASLFAKAVAFRREGILTTYLTYSDLRSELAKAFGKLCRQRAHHPHAKDVAEYLNLDIETIRAVKRVVECEQARTLEVKEWLSSPNRELQSDRESAADMILRWKYIFTLGVIVASKAPFGICQLAERERPLRHQANTRRSVEARVRNDVREIRNQDKVDQ